MRNTCTLYIYQTDFFGFYLFDLYWNLLSQYIKKSFLKCQFNLFSLDRFAIWQHNQHFNNCSEIRWDSCILHFLVLYCNLNQHLNNWQIDNVSIYILLVNLWGQQFTDITLVWDLSISRSLQPFNTNNKNTLNRTPMVLCDEKFNNREMCFFCCIYVGFANNIHICNTQMYNQCNNCYIFRGIKSLCTRAKASFLLLKFASKTSILTISCWRWALIGRHRKRVPSGWVVWWGWHGIHMERVRQWSRVLWVRKYTFCVLMMSLVWWPHGISRVPHPRVHPLLLEFHECRFAGHFLVHTLNSTDV